MRTGCGLWLVVVMLAGVPPVPAAQRSAGTVLQSIQMVVEGGMTVVTIAADGVLPLPTSGSLDAPPRIYFDFFGVSPRTKGLTQVPGAGGVVSRARVALHSVGPNVTRVVLDLTRREIFRVNTDDRQTGRIKIFVGSESVPVRPAPTSPQVAAAPGLPAREVEKYREQLSGALARLEAQRSRVAAIDADDSVVPEALQLAVEEFRDLRRILEAIKPSSALRSTHDLLIASSTLGSVASSFRIEAARNNSAEARRNAASAAAGSLMLFDRACADLGCAGPPR